MADEERDAAQPAVWRKDYIDSRTFDGVDADTAAEKLEYYLKVLYTNTYPYEWDGEAGEYTDEKLDFDSLRSRWDELEADFRMVRPKPTPGVARRPWDPAPEKIPIETSKSKSIKRSLDLADAMHALLTKWVNRAVINEHKKLHRVKRFYFTEPETGPYTSLRLRVIRSGESAGEHWTGSSVEDELPGTMITLAGLNTDEEPYDA
jgi:hypothetical protein